jgi:hypothetical protein
MAELPHPDPPPESPPPATSSDDVGNAKGTPDRPLPARPAGSDRPAGSAGSDRRDGPDRTDRANRPSPPGRESGGDATGAGHADGAEDRADAPDETESAFLEIVARFAERPDEATWPAAEDVRLPPHPPVVVVRPARSPRPPGDPDEPTETDLRVIGDPDDESSGNRAGEPPHAGDGTQVPSAQVPGAQVPGRDDDPFDGHYEPPPPPKAPRMHPVTRAALASVALGVALLVAPALTAAIEPGLTLETIAVLFVLGGVGTLVARMRERPDEGDSPDDGAVV